MNFNTALLHGNFSADKKSGATTTICKANGEQVSVTINQKEANQY